MIENTFYLYDRELILSKDEESICPSAAHAGRGKSVGREYEASASAVGGGGEGRGGSGQLMYDREHILSIGGEGGGRVGGGSDACAKSTHELAGSSLFTEDGDVVPLRVSAAASWGAEGRGGGATEVPKLAHLDMEQLRMPTMRPAFDRYLYTYIHTHIYMYMYTYRCVPVMRKPHIRKADDALARVVAHLCASVDVCCVACASVVCVCVCVCVVCVLCVCMCVCGHMPQMHTAEVRIPLKFHVQVADRGWQTRSGGLAALFVCGIHAQCHQDHFAPSGGAAPPQRPLGRTCPPLQPFTPTLVFSWPERAARTNLARPAPTLSMFSLRLRPTDFSPFFLAGP
jgi:hypothetical protein